MIPLFPEFKNLELSDKEEFERIIKVFEPYSDYNFISLWANNIQNDIRISLLNSNLVMKFRDYITDDPFYSFMGRDQIPETIEMLLNLSGSEGFEKKLKLIPEICVKDVVLEKFHIEEDIDNFDYILAVEEIAFLNGDKYHTHKNFVNRFHKTYENYHIRELNLLDPRIHDQLIQVFFTWETRRNKNREDTKHELTAIRRLLEDANEFDLITLGVYDEEILVGFIVASLEQMNYAISHFSKSDTNYHGITYFMYHSLAKILLEKGYKYLNNEQDLGIPGLRKSKEQWNPTHYLKKYIITEM